jgi:serine/threonine protein phosphatase PrpC
MIALRHAPPPTAPRPPFTLESYGLSDRGRVRASNEDCFVVAELTRTLRVRHTNLPQAAANDSGHRGYVFLVADGVGGHQAGEVASGLSVRTIEDYLLNTLRRFSNLQPGEEQAALRELQAALSQADSRIFEEAARHPEWRGMGTTLTLAFAVNRRLFVAHAGDSRCYLHSGGRLQQLTQDHTVTAEMVRRGILRPENEEGHPYRHVVTNLLGGTEAGVRVELHSLDLHEADVILLCSDGLTEMLPDARIATIHREEREPRAACERLVAEANAAGGRDNITAVVARVMPAGPT